MLPLHVSSDGHYLRRSRLLQTLKLKGHMQGPGTTTTPPTSTHMPWLCSILCQPTDLGACLTLSWDRQGGVLTGRGACQDLGGCQAARARGPG